MASTQDPEVLVPQGLAALEALIKNATAPDGPFPLAEEEVQHFGTVQRYRCFQTGPNSLAHFTLPEYFNDCFTRFNDKEFLVYEGDRLTYGEAMEAAVALSRSIKKEFAIEKGACVAIAGRNYPEWIISLLAINGYLGAMSLPVNSWWTGDELKYGLEDSKTALLIADVERLQRATFLPDLKVPGICMRAGSTEPPLGCVRFEALVEAGRLLPALPLVPVCQDDNAMLMYTSGTTSKPKGVLSTHRGVTAAANYTKMLFYGLGPDVRILASPMFHVNAIHGGLFTVMTRGSKFIMLYKWDTLKALELIQAEKVNTIVGVPTNTYDLMNHPDLDKFDTSSLQIVGGGGAAFAAPMIKRVAQKFKGAKAGTGYGLTETNAFAVIMPVDLFPLRPTSCGVPIPYCDCCILGENDKKLPPGEVGEIAIRGLMVMKEYWGKPEKTAEVFHIDEDGLLWFRSGDIGRMDKDKFVYIMDRAKDIIIRGGENISCAEVEDAIFEHPSVAEVAAIGVPDQTLGELVAVAIVFAKGATPLSFEELKKHAAQRLAAFKVPAEMYIWNDSSLPRGATGKMQKREIREHVAELRKGVPTSKL